MMSGATGELATHGYAVAQLLCAWEYCAYLIARGKIDVSIDAVFGVARDTSAALAAVLDTLDTDGRHLLEALLTSTYASVEDVRALHTAPRPRAPQRTITFCARLARRTAILRSLRPRRGAHHRHCRRAARERGGVYQQS